MLSRTVINKSQTLKTLKMLTMQVTPHRIASTIDRSKVPVLNENDLEEHYVKGRGPGGQKVNKSNNCVYLKHMPTGISVKVHESRDLANNRKLAREKIINLLDNMINKEQSVQNQKKRILEEKSKKKHSKQKKLLEIKKRWKELVTECT